MAEKKLRILHLEDAPEDIELIQETLSADGLACEMFCASTRDAFVEALAQVPIDLVLSDFALPGFDGLSALRLSLEKLPGVPFILLSGTLGEEAAIESLRAGATDYVLKHRLQRLAPAVRRALEEAAERASRKQAEDSLRRSEERFRRVFEESPVGMVLFGADYCIINANQAFCQMVGRSREELLGTRLLDLTHADDRSASLEQVEKLFLGELSSSQLETRYLARDNRIVWGHVTSSLLQDSSRRLLLGLGVVQDITERKNLEEQFRQAQKMEAIGRLAGGVAHDFNNLLGVIMGYSELALMQLGPKGDLRDLLNQILKAGERAASLTRQLLAFSRKQILEPRVLDLNTLLNDLEKMLKRVIGEDIDLITRLQKDLGRVKADQGQLEQIVMNLVVNARDAMPKGGRLTLETANVLLDEGYARHRHPVQPGPYVMLAVSDTGAGMTPEVQARIFEPFFTTKGMGKGTGLGLATVYGIVKQSGGYIWVYSEPGQGSTFKIYLPRVEELAEKAHQAGTAASPRGTETVLVVEDEEEVRELVVKSLQKYGYQVLATGDVDRAVKLAEEHAGPIHLLMTDVVLPKMGGRDLARCLKGLRPDLKVLYTSGYTDDAIVHHGVLEPGVAFLQKPFALSSLARKVREVLDAEKLGVA